MNDKAPAKKSKPQPEMARLIGVTPQLMKQTLDLIQSELVMEKCRAVVFALEACPVVEIPKR